MAIRFPASPTEDAAGNKVQTVIHRMCTNTGATTRRATSVLQASTTAGTGTSKAVGRMFYNTKPMAYTVSPPEFRASQYHQLYPGNVDATVVVLIVIGAFVHFVQRCTRRSP